VPLPQFQPLPLSRARAPFCDPDWLFELKWDGFRSLLYSDRDGVRLVSRNGDTFKSFPFLCEALARDLKKWPQNTIVYNAFWGPNSNTAAHQLGNAGIFFPPQPPGAYGW